MRYRLAYPPTRSVGWPPPPQPAGDGVPTIIIEPTVSPFAANQQSVAQVWEAVRRQQLAAQVWEAVRRAGTVEIARRASPAAEAQIDTCGTAAPGVKMNAATEVTLDGRASPEPDKPQGNASP